MANTLETQSTWNTAFFKDFCHTRNLAHAESLYFLDETLADHKNFFGAQSPFNRNNEWMCAIVYDQHGNPSGRIGMSRPHSWKGYLPVGYYETVSAGPDSESNLSEMLFLAANDWARQRGISELRLPMQGGFFGSYRAKIPNANTPFYGEPDQLERYFEEFQKNGAVVCGHWSTFEVSNSEMIHNSVQILNHFYKSETVPGLKLRPIERGNWRNELKTLRHIFLDSYTSMPEYMPVAEDEFLYLYDSLKYLVHPELCWMAEFKDEPIAFLLGYYDPTQIAYDFAKQFESFPGKFVPDALRKIMFLPKLRANRDRVFLPYTGKLKKTEGSVKGVLAALLLKMYRSLPASIEKSYWAYMADGSPSYKSLKMSAAKEVSKYVMFKRAVS